MLLPSIPPTHVFSAMKITMKWAIVSKKKKRKSAKVTLNMSMRGNTRCHPEYEN